MASNTTIFSGSGSADNVVDQTTTVLPEYLSYIMLFVVLMSIPVVIIPAFSAIVIIIKNKKLQTNNNIFLINLLLTDVGIAVVIWCTKGLLILLYLLGVNDDTDCRIILIPTMLFVIANKVMFLPMCMDRFIHIAFPFSYKRIVTTNAIMPTIVILWIVVIVTSISLYINEPYAYEYIPSLGVCIPKEPNIPQLLILLLCFLIPIVLITITSIYLRYRIIKSKNFFHSVKRSVTQERKSNRAGRLAEILEEQVKPTLTVFRVGGIDALLDILMALLFAVVSAFSSTLSVAITAQFVATAIQYIQSANHSLIYNCDIREKIIGCKRLRNKHSKVIILHRE